MNSFPILCIHSMVADGDGIDPLKTYRDTDCVGKFLDHNWSWGKAVAYNISLTTNDRAYWCMKYMAQSSREIPYLFEGV